MTPPPREGGGHCLAIRNGKAFRVCACVCVWETEWGAEKGWDKFSTTDRALERWAGETSSGIWDVHCHAFLNSWRICCPLHPHPFVSSFGRWKLGCCFVVVAKQGRWESCRDKCALFASTDQSVFWRHPYIISLLGRERGRERARARERETPCSRAPIRQSSTEKRDWRTDWRYSHSAVCSPLPLSCAHSSREDAPAPSCPGTDVVIAGGFMDFLSCQRCARSSTNNP